MKIAFQIACCVLILAGFCKSFVYGAEPRDVKAEAPPDQMFLKNALGGAYYVSSPLKTEYDKLVTRVHELENDLDANRISGPDVLKELDGLKPKLDALRAEIEHTKVLVTAVKIHSQTEEITFDLGPERLLVIIAPRIKIEGWDKPQVKCVLTKTVLTMGDESADSTLHGMAVRHNHLRDSSFVARACEDHYRDGRLHADQDALVGIDRATDAATAEYSVFQGKAMDTIALAGGQDNIPFMITIHSPGGGTYGTTEYPKHFDLTVYVPNCNAIALNGCSSLDANDIHGSLLLKGMGPSDHRPDDPRRVRNLHGLLVSRNVGLNLVENIEGSVTIAGNTAQREIFYDKERLTEMMKANEPLVCRKIAGDLTLRLLMVNTAIEEIGGRVDVVNESGNTHWSLTAPLADSSHRIVSQTGRIDVQIARDVFLPIEAVSECGVLRINKQDDVGQEEIEYGHTYSASQSWYGFRVPTAPRSPREQSERLSAVLEGRNRTAGVDLASREGTIVVQYEKP